MHIILDVSGHLLLNRLYVYSASGNWLDFFSCFGLDPPKTIIFLVGSILCSLFSCMFIIRYYLFLIGAVIAEQSRALYSPQ